MYIKEKICTHFSKIESEMLIRGMSISDESYIEMSLNMSCVLSGSISLRVTLFRILMIVKMICMYQDEIATWSHSESFLSSWRNGESSCSLFPYFRSITRDCL